MKGIHARRGGGGGIGDSTLSKEWRKRACWRDDGTECVCFGGERELIHPGQTLALARFVHVDKRGNSERAAGIARMPVRWTEKPKSR